jgi:hypothetical protein
MRSVLLAVSVSGLLACSDQGPRIDGAWDETADGASAANDAKATPSSDGSSDAAVPEPASDAGKDAAPSTCIDGVDPQDDGHHKPGSDCMSCHASLNPNVRWTIAGTLYDGPSSSTAVGGAHIEIIDAKNKKVVLETASNGNFFTTDTFAFPVKVRGTACPFDLPMKAAVNEGSCNSGSCHTGGMRIHVP